MKQIPGDPDVIDARARAMRAAAERMTRAAETLGRIADGEEFRSDAVDSMRSNTRDLSTTMTNSATRYSGTSNAVAEYSTVLRQAQARANGAIAKAGAADLDAARWSRNTKRAAWLAAQVNPLLSEAERSEVETAYRRAESHYQAQKAIVSSAQSDYSAALADVEQAAATAASRITQANEASRLNDPKPKNFWEWVDQNLGDIKKVLEVIGTVLAVLAVIAAFCLGPITLAVLAIAGAIVALLAFAISVRQYLKGDLSLGGLFVEAGWTVLSLLPGGRAVVSGLKSLGRLKIVYSFHKLYYRHFLHNGPLLGGEGVGYGLRSAIRSGTRELRIPMDGVTRNPFTWSRGVTNPSGGGVADSLYGAGVDGFRQGLDNAWRLDPLISGARLESASAGGR